MHRAFLALLAGAALFAQKLPFDAQALLSLARIGDPQVSPDGRTVAFQVQTIDVPNNKKITQIYVMPVAGGAPRQITHAGQNNERPRWSPDSRRIAYVSDRGGIVADLADGCRRRRTRKQVTNLSTEADGELFSPDGKNLVFTSEVYPECGADDACNKKSAGRRQGQQGQSADLYRACSTGIGTTGRARGAAICWWFRCRAARPRI